MSHFELYEEQQQHILSIVICFAFLIGIMCFVMGRFILRQSSNKPVYEHKVFCFVNGHQLNTLMPPMLKEGWEIVSIQPPVTESSSQIICTFKRKLK